MKIKKWTKKLLSVMTVFILSLALLTGCDLYGLYEDYLTETDNIQESTAETFQDTVASEVLDNDVSDTWSEEDTSDENINSDGMGTEENVLSSEESENSESEPAIDEFGEYSTRDEVALYIHTYGKLPSNYITKKEAQALGWDSSRGNLWDVTDGKSIGGDRFGNYEELLPVKEGRKYYECDINYEGGYRGSDRIIYSNDGLIFYTEDHYETFEQLY